MAILLVLGLSIGWLLATESGTRWLLARASTWIPAELHISEVGGTLVDGIYFRTVTWTDETAVVEVDQIDARFELLPLLRRQLRINTLGVRGVDVSVSDGPTPDVDKAPFALDLPITLRIDDASAENIQIRTTDRELAIEKALLVGQLSGSALQIERLDIHSKLADIRLVGHGGLSGDYPATATAQWELRLQDQPPMSGTLKLNGDALRYEVEHTLAAPYEILTSGAIAVVDNDIQVDLENTWQSLRIETGDGRTIDIEDGTLHLVGTPQLFSFDGDSAVNSAGIPPLAITTRGKLDADRVNVESLSISNEWGRLLANGVAVISSEPNWMFDIELSDLDPAIAAEGLSGNLQVAGRTAGRMVGQQPLVDLWIDSMTGNLNGHPVDGAGAVSYANERFQFNDISVGVGDNRIDVDGSYGQLLRLNAALRGNDLSQLGVGTSGLLNADLQISTNLQTFAATGTLNGERLTWREYSVDTLIAEFDLPATGSGTVRKLDLSNAQLGEWTLREAAEFSLSRSEFHLAKTCFGTKSKAVLACGTLDYNVSGPLRFDATLDELSLADLPLKLPEGSTIRGITQASAKGELINGRLQADASLQVNGLGLDATFEGDAVAANFEQAFAKATVVDNQLVGEFEVRLNNETDHVAGKIEIDDLFDQGSPILGQSSLEWNDLSLLSFFYPDVANPAGRVFGD
ncbi:MAG: hypothetical protein GY949_16720, partial [Gammaproteobacteria bacterium]|nr:hypothetical protein [Gammaproteobacteria bacterium]